MKGLVFLIASAVTLTLAGRAAQAEVTWTLYETSCTPFDGPGCMTPAFPFEVGQLVIPNINSSGTYSFDNEDLGSTPVETGDTDFSFEYGGVAVAPASDNPASSCDRVNIESIKCSWEIQFDSSPAGLSLTVDYMLSSNSTTNVNIGTVGTDSWSGRVGSDDGVLGCGGFLACNVSGYFMLSSVSVPEPSSLASLVSPLIGIFLFVLKRRRTDFC